MDRRTVWAILLMMVIAIAPAILFSPKPEPPGKRPAAPGGRAAAPPADTGPVAPAAAGPSDPAIARPPEPGATRTDTIPVVSPLYRYGISTRGGRAVSATLWRYPSMAGGARAPGGARPPAQILPAGSGLLALTLVREGDTIRLGDLPFTASAESLDVTRGPGELRLTTEHAGVGVELTYRFRPDAYRIDVEGRVRGVGPNGATLLVGLGPTLAQTEADSAENARELALVTKQRDTERHDFGGLAPGEARTLSGPFEWAAVKSKYFVTAVLAADSAGGRISGARLAAPAGAGEHPTRADVRLSLPVPPSGEFRYTAYAGPMEYDRLREMGHDFDDVNPYGWPGFRTIIRVFAVPVRWLLVWMHENLYLPYGVVLIVFGILVRAVLWPLNQKAMRANLQLQAIQPVMKDLQERYKNDPQRMQQEMFKLYKEHNVNPLGGCWPMLLPLPVLFALFFVFQNAIELRGTSFLWIPDLSRPDPLYIIPVVMGLSMWGLTKVGQIGMEQNPQAKMMLYIMPVMMTVLFLNFASGLNLYYAVSNIASIPQQWLLTRERQKRTAAAIVKVKTAPEAAPEPKSPKPAPRPPKRKRA